MTTIRWVHVGDLHMDEADGWQSRERLEEIVRELNEHIGDEADFVFLPGDNANHAAAGQCAAITQALAALRLPWRAIPGDHDFENGTLAAYSDHVPEANRPETEVIASHIRYTLGQRQSSLRGLEDDEGGWSLLDNMVDLGGSQEPSRPSNGGHHRPTIVRKPSPRRLPRLPTS